MQVTMFVQRPRGFHHCVRLTLEKFWDFIMQFGGSMNFSSQMLILR